MGTTTRSRLPYPEPTAPVANGAADIRALAEAVDAAGYTPTWVGMVAKWGPNSVSANVNIPFDTLMFRSGPDWVPGATILVPVGGFYSVNVSGNFGHPPPGTLVFTKIQIGSGGIFYGNTTGGSGASVSGGALISAGEAITCQVYWNTTIEGAIADSQFRIDIARIGAYP